MKGADEIECIPVGYVCTSPNDFLPAERSNFDWIMIGVGVGLLAVMISYI